MKTNYTYKYPRPAITVDNVMLGYADGALKILLVHRTNEPYSGKWALPGGFLHEGESLSDCSVRILKEKVGLENPFMEQLYTFGAPDRDPREHIVSVTYFILINHFPVVENISEKVDQVAWFLWNELPDLAFDHAAIIRVALDRIRAKIRYSPLAFELLPEKFTLSQLQTLFEVILHQTMDRRNFRKKLLSMDILNELEETTTKKVGKPAVLYAFDQKKYDALLQQQIYFEL